MLVCGLDIGSTNIKVVLADESGRSLWVKSVATPRVSDGIGVATDAAALVALLEDMIVEGWRAVAKGEALAAIAATGVGEDGVCADSALQSLGLVIPWFDKRAMAEVERFASRFSFTRADFYTTAAKWMWMRAHREEEIGAAKTWIPLTDYASSLWCGAPFMSETLAARTGCYDVFARCWSGEALSFAEAPPLPRVLKAGEIAGTAGAGKLREAGAASAATLIVAGGHDHPIASSAIQRLDAQARIDSIGTPMPSMARRECAILGSMARTSKPRFRPWAATASRSSASPSFRQRCWQASAARNGCGSTSPCPAFPVSPTPRATMSPRACAAR